MTVQLAGKVKGERVLLAIDSLILSEPYFSITGAIAV